MFETGLQYVALPALEFRQGWPWICGSSPASASQVLVLQVCPPCLTIIILETFPKWSTMNMFHWLPSCVDTRDCLNCYSQPNTISTSRRGISYKGFPGCCVMHRILSHSVESSKQHRKPGLSLSWQTSMHSLWTEQHKKGSFQPFPHAYYERKEAVIFVQFPEGSSSMEWLERLCGQVLASPYFSSIP